MKKLHFLFIAILFLFACNSCKKLNPDEQIPSYIYVSSYTVTTDVINQGTAQQNFTDVWVFVNNTFIGAYPVGSKIPILAEGNTSIKMRAGIKNAGIADLRGIYPMMQFFETTIDLKRGEVQTVIPNFQYFPGITFLKLESFSAPGTFLSKSGLSDTFLVAYNGPEAFPGEGTCAHVYLDDTYRVFDAISGSSMPYTTQGGQVYIEMHYKTNVNIAIVISDGNADIRPSTVLKGDANPGWKKIYIPIADVLNSPSWLNNFYFIIHASVPGNGTIANIYFDNIKIIMQ